MNTHPEDSPSDFDDELPSIDGAIIDPSGEFTVKPLVKTEAAEQPKTASAPKPAVEHRKAETPVEQESGSAAKPTSKPKAAERSPVYSSKVETLLDDIINIGHTKPREEFALDQTDIEKAMDNFNTLEVERGELIEAEPPIETASTVDEERIDNKEIETMLSELESFERRQSGKNVPAPKQMPKQMPMQSGAAETSKAAEPQPVRTTSSFTEAEVQKMLQELAAIEASEEETEEKNAAQNQPLSNRITREIPPVVPASQKESGNHKIPSNLYKNALPAYQHRSSYRAATDDQKRDRRRLFISAAVLCFCALAITAGLVYERKNTQQRIEQSLAASGGQQMTKTNFELLDLVRKSKSKSGGSTIDQEITNTLNRKYGRNWQPVGWKFDQESKENATTTVKFLWSEQGVNKEAVWRIDKATRKIKAANEDAAAFTP